MCGGISPGSAEKAVSLVMAVIKAAPLSKTLLHQAL